MPLINLIQEQRLSSRREEARSRMFFMGFVGVAIASAAAFFFLLYKTDGAQSDLAQLEAKNQKMAPLLRQIEANQKALAILTPRLSTLESAQQVSARWNVILEHLLANMPAETWLTSIRCQAQDATKPINVSFMGMSADQQRVGEFMLRLQNCKELESVVLRSTSEKIVAEGTGIEFEVAGDLAGSIEQKVVAEEAQEGQK